VRFHLIDRLELVDPGRRVRAHKVTSWAEGYWRDRGRGAEMPAPLVLEAFCQAGTWLVLASSDFTRRAALLGIDGVTWHRAVRPGDVLTLDGTVESMSDELAVLSGTAAVEGRTVLTADAVMCALIPAGDLADPADTRRLYAHLNPEEQPA
jgi:3-hydroxyacyl-[acyl-carrier-protein] dehydratase